jgi:hypothetical protein
METIRFSPIAAQDIRFGTGSFEVILADGRTVTVDEVDIGYWILKLGLKVYASSGALPTTDVVEGSIAYVTGSGLYQYSGSAWSAAGAVHNHSAADITSGTLAVARGGNGADFSAAAQGVILYFSAAGVLSALTPGTSGQYLKTQGAAANPAWANFTTGGTYGSIGQNSFNNAGAPTAQMDLVAQVVILRNSDNEIVTRYNPGTITNNTGTAGSVANGRDQAAAFTADTFVYFYWIWNGATLASVSSATSPPTGPTLPSGYTHWSFAGCVRFNGSSQLVLTRITGNTAWYYAGQSALSAGAATSDTSVNLATFVPGDATGFILGFSARAKVATAGGRRQADCAMRHVTGSDFYTIKMDQEANGSSMQSSGQIHMPNSTTTFRYQWTLDADASNNELDVHVLGYVLRNGGT